MNTRSLEITKRLLLKHTATVHSSSRLTMIQKKIFNLFIYKAFPTIKDDKYHTYTVTDLLRSLNWSEDSHINDRLKESLAGLTRENVKWNVLEKDRKNKWVSSACLADVSIKNGIIEYSFGKFLREVLHNPNIYAKIDLDVQGSLESRDSLIIWEIAMEELSSKKCNEVVTSWIEWEKMCSITSGEGSSYSKTYSLYKSKVLKKAIEEINAKTDLSIHMLEQKESRKIKRIAFKVQRQLPLGGLFEPEQKEIFSRDLKLKQNILQIMGNSEKIEQLWAQHTDERLRSSLRFYREVLSSSDHQVKNPVAFLKKAIEEGWCSAEDAATLVKTMSFENNLDKPEMSKLIFTKPGEIDKVRIIRQHLCEEFGLGVYHAWFNDAIFQLVEDKCIIFHPNLYAPTYIMQKLYHPLLKWIKNVDPNIGLVEVQNKQYEL
jgi:plasmid replication initiation protein